MTGYRVEIIVGIVFVGFIALFLFISSTTDSNFSGTDDLASGKISEITGIPEEKFIPIIGQWRPPSGEIESLLFVLQAVAGVIILGLVFGYWLGRRTTDNKREE